LRRNRLKAVTYGSFLLAFFFFAFSYLADPGDGGSDEQPAPLAGKSVTLHVVNQGISLRFRDKFGFELEQKGAPDVGVDMPERMPITCRFRIELTGKNGRRSIREFDNLHHIGEYPAGGTAFFASDYFNVPGGQSEAKVSNLGCLGNSLNPTAVVDIGPVGDHLGVLLLAKFLRFLGWSAIGLGILMGALNLIRQRRSLANE
jgi:hypothetical protein